MNLSFLLKAPTIITLEVSVGVILLGMNYSSYILCCNCNAFAGIVGFLIWEVRLLFKLIKSIQNEVNLHQSGALANICRNEAQFGYLHDAFVNDREIDVVIQRIVDIGYKALDSERVSVMLRSKDKEKLIVTESKDLKGFEIDARKGISGFVVSSGQSVNIEDASSDLRFNPSLDKELGFKTKSILCVPIFVTNGEIVGCISAINKIRADGQSTSFSRADEDVLACVAANAGVAVKKAQMYASALKAYRKSSAVLSIVRARSSDKSIEQIMNVTTWIPSSCATAI